MIIKDNSKYYTKENKGSRFYYKNDLDIPYPSVTTIISQQKQKSAKKNYGTSPSMVIGTLVHYHILKRYSKEILPLPYEPIWNVSRSEVRGRISRCLKMWNDLNLDIRPIAIETALFCNDPRYAGRLDMLAKINNELCLIDLKTGKDYPNHIMQAAAYWHMLNRKPKVCFIYLDGILDRNPEQKAVVKYFTMEELEKGYEDFLDKYSEFSWE